MTWINPMVLPNILSMWIVSSCPLCLPAFEPSVFCMQYVLLSINLDMKINIFTGFQAKNDTTRKGFQFCYFILNFQAPFLLSEFSFFSQHF